MKTLCDPWFGAHSFAKIIFPLKFYPWFVVLLVNDKGKMIFAKLCGPNHGSHKVFIHILRNLVSCAFSHVLVEGACESSAGCGGGLVVNPRNF